MKNVFRPASKIFAYLAISSGLIFNACDTFENDNLSKEKEVTIDKNEFFSLPSNSTVIDLKSVVRSFSNVNLTITQPPRKGNLSKLSESLYKYTPNSTFQKGRDSFGIEVSRDGKTLLTDSVFITIDADTTQFPCSLIALEDSLTLSFSTSPTEQFTIIKVLENDIICGVDLDDVVLTIYEGPSKGLASVVTLFSPVIKYKPSLLFQGEDQLIYRITSALDSTKFSYGLIRISGQPVNCTLVAADDSLNYYVDGGSPLAFVVNVFDNDQKCVENLNVLQVSILEAPVFGAASYQNGKLYYDKFTSFTESYEDSFIYEICKEGVCSTAKAKLVFYFGDCDVIAHEDFVNIPDSAAFPQAYIQVLNNDQFCGDVDVTITQQPKSGEATLAGNIIFYRAENQSSPSDTLKYSICPIGFGQCSETYIYINRN